MYLKTQGLVLRVTEYRDSDAMLTVLTKEQGLMSFKARGVRSRRSQLKSACQLLCFSEFTLLERQGYYTVSEAVCLEMFQPMRNDIELLALCSYFAQAAGAFIAAGCERRRGSVADAQQHLCVMQTQTSADAGQSRVRTSDDGDCRLFLRW